MAGQIDIIVAKQAQKEVDLLITSLKTTYDEIIKINQTAVNFNGQTAPKNPTQVKKATEELTAIEKQRLLVLKQLETTNARIAIANDRNTQSLNQQRTALRSVNSAYLQLSQAEQASARRLQDLIARGREAAQTQRQYNNELKKAQNEFNKYNARVIQADTAVKRFNRNVGNYPTKLVGSIGNLMGAFGIVGGVSLFATIARDIFQTTKQLQSLNNALKQVSGTQDVYLKNQAFLADISERFGLEVKGLTEQFTQFYVSAKDKLSGQEIEQIFTSISKAGAVMGLSVDSQNRAFLAINQMMSKGTIQAEELRGQLGEALPGALGIMAKSLNVTEKQLGDMMKAGELLAADVLPRFAKQLEKTYGIETIDRVETLAAAQNRLTNEWTAFIKGLDEGSGVVSNFFKSMISELTETIKWWRKLNEATATATEIFGKKTDEGFSQQLKQIQSEADKTGVSLQKLALVRQGLAVEERAKAKAEIKERQDRIKELNAMFDSDVAKSFARVPEKIDIEKKKIMELTKSYGYYNGVIKATQYILKNNTTSLEEETKEIDKNAGKVKKATKAKKEAEIYQVGTAKWLQQQISQIKNLNDTLSTSSEEYQTGVGAIKFYEQWLERLTQTAKEAKKELEGIELDLGDDKNVTDSEGDRLREEGDRLREILAEFKKSFIDDFADQSGFGKTLELLSGGLDKFEGDAISTALAVSEAFQEAFNTIASFSNANFEQMYMNLEQQRDVSILFAGESATAKEEIERQYEERRKKIQRQQAESQKRMAMFNIAMNTAQGIMSTIAQNGFPAAIPMIIAIGAIGAVQLGLVASQPIPAFAEGGTHDGGLMLVNDAKGNGYKEKIVTPDGKVISPKGRNVVMNAPKGTQIFTENQWEKQLNSILLNNGINQTQNANNSNDTVVNVQTKDNYHFSIDEGGISKFITRGTTKTNILNSRFKIQGKDV